MSALGKKAAASVAPQWVHLNEQQLSRNVLHLPRLPIPKLEDTARRYGLTMEPLLKQPSKTKTHVDKFDAFVKTTGPKIQQLLQEQDHKNSRLTGHPPRLSYPHSYIEKIWDDGYLCYRGPSPVNISPAFCMKRFPTTVIDEVLTVSQLADTKTTGAEVQCATAAAVLHGILRFAYKIQSGQLDAVTNPKPEDAATAAAPGGPAVDVSQLQYQFGFSRVPHPERDNVVRFPLHEGTRHAVILYRGYLYKLNLLNERGEAFSVATLTKALVSLKQQVQQKSSGSVSNPLPLGVLTSLGRTDWFQAYEWMLRNGGAQSVSTMAAIQQGLICICLDETNWKGDATTGATNVTDASITAGATKADCDALAATAAVEELAANNRVCRGMLVGSTSQDSSNRWYDKHQIIIDAGGVVAGNFEHAFSDGLSWSRWMNEVYCDLVGTPSGYDPLPGWTLPSHKEKQQALPRATSHRFNAEPTEDTQDLIAPIEFNFPTREAQTQIQETVAVATTSLTRLIDSVSLRAVNLKPWGKKEAKNVWKMSPDAFCQIAFHLAYFRLHGKVAPTYESCSTAAFWHGRTETIRSATNEMSALVHALPAVITAASSPSVLSTEQKEKFAAMVRAAATRHVQLAKEAAQGQGVDRHLLALKEIVKSEKDSAGLEFFNDTLYEYGGTWLLSTSNVSQPFMDWFNFGPVTGDGYGIGYNILEEEIHIGVSCLSASSQANTESMRAALEIAAKDVAWILGSSL